MRDGVLRRRLDRLSSAREGGRVMFKVECRRCEKELDVPGALAFGVPDTDGAVNRQSATPAAAKTVRSR